MNLVIDCLMRGRVVWGGILCLIGGGELTGGSITFDFETDVLQDERLIVATTQPDFIWQDGESSCGAGRVCVGGNNSKGFLSLTEARNDIRSAVIFPELDEGQAVEAFRITADIRMGSGSTDRTGDGFSLNFARAGDPVLLSGGESGFYGGQFENGVSQGIVVGFDSWGGNSLPDGDDVEGIIIRIDDQTILKHPMATRNGRCSDQTSMQTGARLTQFAGRNPSGLCWQTLELELDLDGFRRVTWKGLDILSNFQTHFIPSAGQVVLAGRTGIVNEFVHVDNLRIQTDAVDLLPEKVPGGLVTFANIGDGLSAPILDVLGVPLGDDFRAQLQHANGIDIGLPTPFIGEGFFSGGVRQVDGVGLGENTSLRVAVLNRSDKIVGVSDPFSIVLGGAGDPPAPPPGLLGLQPFRISTQSPRSRLVDGLIAQFPFDGSAANIIGMDLPVTVTGAKLAEDRFGTPESAYFFDGEDDMITVADPKGIVNFEQSDFSLTAWIQTSSDTESQYIVSKLMTGMNAGYGLGLDSGQRPVAYLADVDDAPSFLTVEGTRPLDDGDWHFLVAVFDRDKEATLYLDRRRIASGPIAPETPLPGGMRTLTIGAVSGGDSFFNGRIDDVRLYDRILEVDEIRDLSRWQSFSISLGRGTRMVLEGDEVRWDAIIRPMPGSSQEITYRWELNGERISSAAARSFVLQDVSLGDVGGYSVVVVIDGEEFRSPPVDLSIGKQTQEITWEALEPFVLGGGDVSLSAMASSGLPVAFELVEGSARLEGDILTPLAGGTITVVATQEGNERFLPAVESVRTIDVLLRADVVSGEGGRVAMEPLRSDFRLGEELTLTATAEDGFGFLAWAGDIVDDRNPLVITVKENIRIEAEFAAVWPLVLDQSDGGRLISNPEKTELFDATRVSLLAVPEEGYRFDHWIGDIGGNQNPALIIIKQPVQVSAVFVEHVPPRILSSSLTIAIREGDPFSYSAEVAGEGPFEFQWMQDNDSISGERARQIAIEETVLADSGVYSLEVKNPAGEVVKELVILQILKPVVVVNQPDKLIGTEGENVLLEVEVSGDGPLQFEWSRDGIVIDGEAGSSLVFDGLSESDVGEYTLSVSNPVSTVMTQAIQVSVVPSNDPPTLVNQPTEVWVKPGVPVEIAIEGLGENIQYQWFKDDSLIDGARESNFSIESAGPSSVGSYLVSLTNEGGSVTSEPILVRLFVQLQISRDGVGLRIKLIGGQVGEEWRIESSTNMQQWEALESVIIERGTEGPIGAIAIVETAGIGRFFRAIR